MSAKCAKSIIVSVSRGRYYPKYDKVLESTKRIMAHDPGERAIVGDVVRIVPCRPMSKKKRHQLVDILNR